ncbi:MAG TPA: hypothetical protein VF553_14695 [Pyrinomonadaceae bacterium]|jgi:hypothetical protein
MDKNKLQPAIIGGVALGLLSALPFVNVVNLCCCAWAVMGGMLAAHLYIKRSPVPVSIGEGAKIGAIAGLVGGLITIIIGIPLSLLTNTLLASFIESMASNNPAAEPMLAEYVRQLRSGSIIALLPRLLLYSIVNAAFLIGFATIGSIIGVSLFEKRQGGPGTAPPPPPTFPPGGAQAGGSYGAGYGPGQQQPWR